MHYGFIGLGNLGRNLAGSLVRKGFKVTVTDIDKAQAEKLIAGGAHWAETAKAVASQVDAVITCLPSPKVSERVLSGPDGILAGLKKGATWIEMSTLDTDAVERLAKIAADNGIRMMEAPVTGGVHLAASGEITVIAGGDADLFALHRPAFQAMGKQIFHAGDLGKAAVIKVITNMLAFIHLCATGEALMLAKKGGIDLTQAFNIIKASSGNSFVHETEGQVILNGSYNINFTMDLALKDLGFALGFGREFGVPLELAGLVEQTFVRAKAVYGGQAWSSQVVKLLEDATERISVRPASPPNSKPELEMVMARESLPSLGTFDYVIVGAGSAGSALADLLSRDPKNRVALVEAGGTDKRFFVQMPLGYGKTFYDQRLNWGFRADPDPGLDGQSDYWPRGKVIGGSGSLNAMVWIRGAAADYDEWAAAGNPGWSFSDVLPVFKAIEDNEAGADEYRGRGGPIHITDPTPMLHPLARRFIEAGQQAGFAYNPDFNGATQEGVGIYQINTKGGWRCSSARAFLWPALKRRNLVLFKQAHVTRILIENGRATGIALVRGGQSFRIDAAGEVILSAGAVNSPQLLQLSGIGRGEDQQAAGLPVLQESPAVGHHLQDHLGINYTYRAKAESLNALLRSWWGKLAVGSNFLLRGKGPLSLSLNQGGGFVKSRPELDRPNIQLYLQAISTVTGKVGTRPLLTPDPFPGFNLGLSSCRPHARGTILARSPDPFAAPAIRPNAFGTEEDRRDMLEGVKLLRRIAAQPAMAGLIEEELAPGKAVVSDEDLMRDYARRSGTVYHACGTARMGPDPKTAVVDHRLRVHGVEGLRVADASVFPAVISGNTNAAAIMVGVKAAEMVLDDGRG